MSSELRDSLAQIIQTDGGISASKAGILADTIYKRMCAAQPTLLQLSSLEDRVKVLEKEYHDFQEKVGGIVSFYDKMKESFVQTPIPTPDPQPILNTNVVPASHTIVNDDNKDVTADDYKYVIDNCSITISPSAPEVISVHSNRTKKPYAKDGAAWRITINGKQKRISPEDLYQYWSLSNKSVT